MSTESLDKRGRLSPPWTCISHPSFISTAHKSTNTIKNIGSFYCFGERNAPLPTNVGMFVCLLPRPLLHEAEDRPSTNGLLDGGRCGELLFQFPATITLSSAEFGRVCDPNHPPFCLVWDWLVAFWRRGRNCSCQESIPDWLWKEVCFFSPILDYSQGGC